MATIKTNFSNNIRSIITKVSNGQRVVSCTCCEAGGCCLYPAQAFLDGLYTIDDLPDTVIVIGQFDFGYQIEFTKGTGAPNYYNGPDGQRITITTAGGTPEWEVQVFTEEDGWIEPQDRSPNSCLIFEPAVPEPNNTAYVADVFQDTYTVSGPRIDTTTITRQELCLWTGTTTIYPIEGPPQPYLIFLSYVGYEGQENFDEYLKWEINGEVKDGNQNTPVGYYPLIEFTVS